MSSLEVALSATRIEAWPLIVRNQTRRYDLAAAQAARIEIGPAQARRTAGDLGGDLTEARKFIAKLFKSLRPNDFAHVETMPQPVGRPLYGDVYGKESNGKAWFIKFRFEGGNTTVLMSCHEPERPLELVDGRTLRSRK